jgi:hypothetical protein
MLQSFGADGAMHIGWRMFRYIQFDGGQTPALVAMIQAVWKFS